MDIVTILKELFTKGVAAYHIHYANRLKVEAAVLQVMQEEKAKEIEVLKRKEVELLNKIHDSGLKLQDLRQ